VNGFTCSCLAGFTGKLSTFLSLYTSFQFLVCVLLFWTVFHHCLILKLLNTVTQVIACMLSYMMQNVNK